MGPLNVSFPHPLWRCLLPWVRLGTTGPTLAGTSSLTPAIYPQKNMYQYTIFNFKRRSCKKRKEKGESNPIRHKSDALQIEEQSYMHTLHICLHMPGSHGNFGFTEHFYQSLQLLTSLWICPCVYVCLRVLLNLSGIFPLEHFDTDRVHLMWQQLGMQGKVVFFFFAFSLHGIL